MSLVSLYQGNVKNPENRWKLTKIANTDRVIPHNFWMTWGISMKFSGKMWLMILLKSKLTPAPAVLGFH